MEIQGIETYLCFCPGNVNSTLGCSDCFKDAGIYTGMPVELAILLTLLGIVLILVFIRWKITKNNKYDGGKNGRK